MADREQQAPAGRSAELARDLADLPLAGIGSAEVTGRVRELEIAADDLSSRCSALGAADLAALAGAIARVLPHLGAPDLAADHALTLLVSAAETLHQALAHEADPTAITAARYQLETLIPRPPAPDVPLSALRSRKK